MLRIIEGITAAILCLLLAIPIAVIRGIRWGLRDAWRELLK